jgi:glycosyltransferase involved in cell wall biosynthesis
LPQPSATASPQLPPDVVLATHYWAVGPATALDEYLRPRAASYLFIAHPLYGRPALARFRRFRAAAQVEAGERLPLRGPLRYPGDLWRTVRWARRGDAGRLFIAGDNLLALAGLWLRRRRRVKAVILYSIDYVPRRFANPLLNRLYHTIDRYAVDHVDVVWNTSSGLEQARFARDRAASRAPQLVVPVGASYRRIRRLPLAEIDAHRIAFLGHLVERQGLQLAIEALPIVRRAVPDATLLVIGDGPYAPELKRLAKDLGIEEAIDFAGYSDDHPAIEARLARCAVGLAPYAPDPDSLSRFQGLPGKIKNYLACGLAVVLTGVPMESRLVEDAGAGRVVAYQKEPLAGAIVDYLSDPERLRRARQAAATLAAAFDWDDLFDQAFARTLSLLLPPKSVA